MNFDRYYNEHYQSYMRQAMREAEEQARQEYDRLTRQPASSPPQPQYQLPPQPINPNNALLIEVATEEEARKYSVKDRNGDPIIAVNDKGGELYVKWLDVGTGDWIMDVYDRRTQPIEAPASQTEIDKIYEILEVMRDKLTALENTKPATKTNKTAKAAETSKEPVPEVISETE